MRIVMLGWEFPPFIAGGLGTACYGLTKALDRQGEKILFVLPRAVDRSLASHVRLLSPEGRPVAGGLGASAPASVAGTAMPAGDLPTADQAWELSRPAAPGERPRSAPGATLGFENTTFVGVPAGFTSPYKPFLRPVVKRRVSKVTTGASGEEIREEFDVEEFADEVHHDDHHAPHDAPKSGPTFGASGAGAGYRGDLFAESERYSRLVVSLTKPESFDVVHAHDWLTFPAGMALARVTGKPLVVHVHSTEFDRSGDNVNQRVYDVERRGMLAAMRVICVSELTRNIVVQRYGIDPTKVEVVYNGIDSEAAQPRPGDKIGSKDKIVLFLGRITMQKGPEYFIAAAKRVLEKVPEAKFIIAGSGDMELRMIELAAELGIGHRVLFTGFLRGNDVERVFRMADCYVMPSVSEPFGIAPLEAIRADVPTIISKQSGVSEVLSHTLKVDFWDIDEMANKIVAVLRHPPLSQTLREHGSIELRRLTWDDAAQKCREVYERATKGQPTPFARF